VAMVTTGDTGTLWSGRWSPRKHAGVRVCCRASSRGDACACGGPARFAAWQAVCGRWLIVAFVP
jgi:hypothetical protein